MRTTLQNMADGMLPESIGICAGDLPRLAARLNLAQKRLIPAGGDNGWWGSWDKATFLVKQCDPYITLPSQYARMVNVNVCRYPTAIQNEWYEMLEMGIGLQNPICDTDLNARRCAGAGLSAFDRGTVSTAYDLLPRNQIIRAYITDQRDRGKRILFSNAIDQNGVGIYSQDGLNPVNGFYITFDTPFADSQSIVTSFSKIAKDVTFGDIVLRQVDNETTEETFLTRLGPNETNPSLRRYYFKDLPKNCCCDGTDNVQITAMLKLEYAPVKYGSDFLIIGNEAALIEECQSIRFSLMDGSDALGMAGAHHRAAIALLREELVHYLGALKPAVNVAPFGTARLGRQKIGSMI